MVRARDVMIAVSDVFDVPLRDLVSASRTSRIKAARDMAIVVMRDETDLSFPDIARVLGLRSHASVHRVYALRDVDETTRELVAEMAARAARHRIGLHRNPWEQPPVPARWLIASRRAVGGGA